jgi:hypothetical protein
MFFAFDLLHFHSQDLRRTLSWRGGQLSAGERTWSAIFSAGVILCHRDNYPIVLSPESRSCEFWERAEAQVPQGVKYHSILRRELRPGSGAVRAFIMVPTYSRQAQVAARLRPVPRQFARALGDLYH